MMMRMGAYREQEQAAFAKYKESIK
jgi:hypothetical protein